MNAVDVSPDFMKFQLPKLHHNRYSTHHRIIIRKAVIIGIVCFIYLMHSHVECALHAACNRLS